MAKPARLDAELVRRGLVASRAQARRAIEGGSVTVRGVPATRTATMVSPDVPIALTPPPDPFVSRGAHKLEGALSHFDVVVEGRDWLDAGASTGGFTDLLLQRGARTVIAADVGYGQLHWRLRNDERVVVLERVNVRHLTRGDLPWEPGGVVADLSFISLSLVLPALVAVASDRADFVVLVKPQFEAGREAVGRTGVVRDPEVWRGVLENIREAAANAGLGLAGACVSPLVGPAGNKEFFLHLRAGAAGGQDVVEEALREAR
ncbi:MAG TPA: TlyA family RNA methyltransferase [Actinomycetota bacterium]|nr:TlyA family RNA methyltransferase [Actinomycetota bacterium]